MNVTPEITARSAGLYAQEVAEVLPEAVIKAGGEVYDKQGNPIEDPLSVNYSALSALYVEGFKALISKVEELEGTVEALKAAAVAVQAIK